jgi:hypothetical protein
MSSEKLLVNDDGTVSQERVLTERERLSKLDEIRAKIEDPNFSQVELSRLIAIEIATCLQMMIQFGDEKNYMENWKVKVLSDQVKALRELGKQVSETDVLSKRDYINLDGPKFAFVAEEWREGFKEAMKDAGLDESTMVSVMKHWRDVMVKREPDIRRSVEKVESK